MGATQKRWAAAFKRGDPVVVRSAPPWRGTHRYMHRPGSVRQGGGALTRAGRRSQQKSNMNPDGASADIGQLDRAIRVYIASRGLE
jgi:hypothetical protein